MTLTMLEEQYNRDSLHQKRCIVEPNDNDILCGRGGLSNHHPGNARYRSLIRRTRCFYRSCPKFAKLYVSKAIVLIMNEGGGRFLERSQRNGFWCTISNKKAVQKTSQALRERKDEEHSLTIPQALLEKLEEMNQKQNPRNLEKIKKSPVGTQTSSHCQANKLGSGSVCASSTAEKTKAKDITSPSKGSMFSDSPQPPSFTPVETTLLSPLQGPKSELDGTIVPLDKEKEIRNHIYRENMLRCFLSRDNLFQEETDLRIPDALSTSVLPSFLLQQPTLVLQNRIPPTGGICLPSMTKREVALELCKLHRIS